MRTAMGLGALVALGVTFTFASSNAQDQQSTPQPCPSPAATAGPGTLAAPTPAPTELKKLPGKRTPPTITLKRGMTRNVESACPPAG